MRFFLHYFVEIKFIYFFALSACLHFRERDIFCFIADSVMLWIGFCGYYVFFFAKIEKIIKILFICFLFV
jgi:hypothetical protein